MKCCSLREGVGVSRLDARGCGMLSAFPDEMPEVTRGYQGFLIGSRSLREDTLLNISKYANKSPERATQISDG
ncbi:hypothetical protein F0919_15750 [Taibaiella lutea]|uniref:Uncharacterized protein n=1 Tax=Taibaiella lutea TaxID=2608001 RepID=A0A5M6CCR5_9BACT|nr:hypothetical protein [Taibaiella lutea]KAA5532250.1 hypothetical protein F0919_15750 [Taibaiella lutea]